MKRGSTALSLLGLFLLFLCIMGDSAVKHELWIKPGMLLRADPIQGLVALKASEPDYGPVFTDGDAYYWLSYAQDILSKHEFRVRETHLDNAPYGRQVHWFSGLTWLLAGLALITHHAGAIPITKALEYAGLVSGPLLAATVLLLLQPFLVSRLSRWTTFFFLLSVVLLPVWRKEFSYGRIDHNGFVVGLAVGMLLCLYTTNMGFVPIHRKRKNEPVPCACKAYRTEQRWFVASGIFGGLGLWVQASFFLLMILAVGLGVFAYAWFYVSRRHHSFRTACTYYALLPQLWRTWAWAGASTSLIFYFVEYFPAHMGMRLEVNHPLYALCWLGLTEALVQFMWHEMGTCSRPWQGWLGLVAGLALPAILAWGPSTWFTLHDPALLRIHTLIREFDPLRAVMPHAGWLAPLLLFGGLPLLLAPALFVLASSRYTALLKIRMLVGVVSSAILLWATWNMNRMAGLCMAALLALGYVVLEWLGRPEVYQRTDRTRPRRFSATIQEGRLSVTISAALMLIGLAGFGIDLHGSWPRLRDGTLGEDVATRIALRDLALAARRIIPEADRVVISGFNETPLLQYFGGFQGTGGLYWENARGLHATIDFLAAHDDEDARRVAVERSLRGVIIWSSDEKIEQFHFSKFGHKDPESIRKTLAYRLTHGGPYPDWIGPISFNSTPLAKGMQFTIFRILPERAALPPPIPATAVQPDISTGVTQGAPATPAD